MIKNDEPDEPLARGESRRREHLIEGFLATLCSSWVSACFQELSQAKRNIEGGWPGRLAEARALVLRELPKELAAKGLAAPSATELVDAAVAVNDYARSEWLRVGKAQRFARRQAP